MCNSWNHSYDCRCGFGGEGHLGKSSASAGIFESNFLNHRISYESFVNPNAKCPVCKEPVFFYQSPYGGRVFFDELGHPWLKHPCTDTSLKNLDVGLNIESNDEKSKDFTPERNWEKEGWESLVCYQLELDHEIDRIRFVGYSSKYTESIRSDVTTWGDRYEYSLYWSKEIPFITLSIKNINKWFQNKSCVFMIYPILIRQKKDSENHFELSTFTVNKDGVLEVLYTDEAYKPKASNLNEYTLLHGPLQRKRVYRNSPEEMEIIKNWKVDIEKLNKLRERVDKQNQRKSEIEKNKQRWRDLLQ